MWERRLMIVIGVEKSGSKKVVGIDEKMVK